MNKQALEVLPHAQSPEDLEKKLETNLERGLSSQEAQKRLEQLGPNELEEQGGTTIWQMIINQFADFLIVILVAAAVLSALVGEPIDSIVIMAIVVLNAVLGTVQESRAEKALAALKKMAAPDAMTIRDGKHQRVPARELVPGDVVALEAGNYVPADLRLLETFNLRIEEASLTGESVPVEKKANQLLPDDAPLGDRKNAAFMSTMINYGRGMGLVVRTGMDTQIGKIAEMIQSYETEATPLQKRLNQLGKVLGTVSLAVCGLILIYGIIRDTQLGEIITDGFAAWLTGHQEQLIELLMTAVSLAIAAVPEGLPAVVTICLALGMQRMVARHALIRRLPAVETLGCATVICTDKTGTLTQNQMTAVEGWVPDESFRITGEGYEPEGKFQQDGTEINPRDNNSMALLLRGGLLCNDSSLETVDSEEQGDGEKTRWRIIGDPTEGALVVAAAKAAMWKEEQNKSWPRVSELPFDSERKRMTTVHQVPEDASERRLPGMKDGYHLAFIKGAPDVVAGLCSHILVDGDPKPMDDKQRERILSANQNMARRALRVLAVAYLPMEKPLEDGATPEHVEKDLTFVGLVGMIDPARPEVKGAVELARKAGMRSIMVTGDYKETAAAIADEIGLLRPGGKVLSGSEIDELSDEEFSQAVEETDAFARVSPEHKVRIVEALKSKGHIAAMTGDGVNDAPALKRANIGVAMGITGTDVSKETAEMVLTDDNFASIISAVEEGRIIYSNIRKFVFFLISCNIGEILIIFLSMLFGLPIPLSPIQLLWLNLVTDGAPALALGLEKGDPDIMDRPPRPTDEPVINKEMLIGLVVQAVAMTGGVLAAYLVALNRFDGVEAPRTVAFATLVISELFRAFTARSERYSLFGIGAFSNKWMNWAILASVAMLLAVMYVPFMQPLFDTVSLSIGDWLFMIPFALVASVAAEITKMFLRIRYEGKQKEARR